MVNNPLGFNQYTGRGFTLEDLVPIIIIVSAVMATTVGHIMLSMLAAIVVIPLFIVGLYSAAKKKGFSRIVTILLLVIPFGISTYNIIVAPGVFVRNSSITPSISVERLQRNISSGTLQYGEKDIRLAFDRVTNVSIAGYIDRSRGFRYGRNAVSINGPIDTDLRIGGEGNNYDIRTVIFSFSVYDIDDRNNLTWYDVDAVAYYFYSRLIGSNRPLGWSTRGIADYTIRVSAGDNFIVPVACDNYELLEIIPAESVEVRHNLRQHVLSGGVYRPPIVSVEICRACGWSSGERDTDWSFVWVIPIFIFGFLFLIVQGLMYRNGNALISKGIIKGAGLITNAIIPVIALVLPLLAIITFQSSLNIDPVFVYRDIPGLILLWVLSLLTLIPILLVFFSRRGKSPVRQVIGMLLGAGITFGLIFGGNYLRDQLFGTEDYITAIGLINAGLLYGAGCIMALVSVLSARNSEGKPDEKNEEQHAMSQTS